MAQRRMFSLHIVDTDAFLDMPSGAQLLYFHMAMRADDDGFVSNPKKIARVVGASDDDMKVLLGKRFILAFESGIIVIKHWRMHNYIRKDTYNETRYIDEKNKLSIKENGSYTERQRPVDGSLPQDRLGKVRIGKDNTSEPSSQGTLVSELIKKFEEVDAKNKTYYGNKTQRAAAQFLLDEYGMEEVCRRISVLPKTNQAPYFPKIYTPVQLRDKWKQLEDAAQSKRNEVTSKQRIVI